MKVVLLNYVKGWGHTGEVVEVKPGFARNFLFPRQLAKVANKQTLMQIEQRRHEIEAETAAKRQQMIDLAAKIDGLSIELQWYASQLGRLYGSLRLNDIIEAFKQQHNIVLHKEWFNLIDKFNEIKDYTLDVHLFKDVHAQVTVKVVPKTNVRIG